MDDRTLLELYLRDDPRATEESLNAHGYICRRLAMNILAGEQEAELCLREALAETREAIPPARPNSLCAFVCRIVRNLSINRLRDMKAERRSRDLTLSLEELESCISVDESRADILPGLISAFLEGLDETDRKLFMGRYFHATPVKSLAETYGMTPNAVSIRLFKIREGLRLHLEEGGYTV